MGTDPDKSYFLIVTVIFFKSHSERVKLIIFSFHDTLFIFIKCFKKRILVSILKCDIGYLLFHLINNYYHRKLSHEIQYIS